MASAPGEPRRATPADVTAIAGLQQRVWWHAYEGILGAARLAQFDEEDGHEAHWTRTLGDPRAETWVTEHEGRITGTTTVGPSREEGAATGLGELWSIAVEPGAQGAGLGSALHAHACVRLGALGFTAAMLWVFEENGLARAFYEARGWTLDLPGAGTAPEEWYLAPCVRYRRVVG